MALLNVEDETFVMYIVVLAKPIIIPIYCSHEAQVTLSKSMETCTKYFDFSNVFSLDSAAELLAYGGINNYSINLFQDKQLFYSLIYSLGPVELEMLKIYIKTNLANNFIRHSKLLTNTPILFVQKKYSSLYLYVRY